MLGARHILIPKFEVKPAVEAIDLYGVTSLITVPAMMADLVSLIRCLYLCFVGLILLLKTSLDVCFI